MASIDIAALKQKLPFEVQGPNDAGYTHSLERWAAQRVRSPQAIVFPESAQEVSLAVKQATGLGMRIAVRCGGMSPDATSTTEGIIIDLSKMNEVEAFGDTAVIGGGAIGSKIDTELGNLGKATVTPNVNLVGYAGMALGGGFGKLSGQYGLALDNIVSVEMVLANGSIVKASQNENQDLFWAIRGGGGNFGIVPTFTVKIYDVPKAVFGGALIFPFARAPEVFDQAATWTKTADTKAALNIILRKMGEDVICMCNVYYTTGDEEFGKSHFKAFFDLQPVKTMVGLIPWSAVSKVPIDWNEPAMATFATHNSPSGQSLQPVLDQYMEDQKANVFHMMLVQYFSREAICAVPSSATAFAGRDKVGNVILFSKFSPGEEESKRAREASSRLRDMINELSPTRMVYLNTESHSDAAMMREVFKENLGRLEALKAKYDPGCVFRQWHGFTPAKL